ncbi:MAG: hypothetical protein ACOYU3_10720 [Bacillota bacterium]
MQEHAKKKKTKRKSARIWALKITLLTFIIAIGISVVSQFFLRDVPLLVAVFILFLLIGVGIIFDIIGIAIASADCAPFVAMAAKRVFGAKRCIRIVNNASVYTNICNDVIGDICGIVSGAAGATIALSIIMSAGSTLEMARDIVISGLISALTVGGKAAGKSFAMRRHKDIVFFVGRAMAVVAGDK